MSYDDNWPDQTWEMRRLMVLKTIRPVALEELKKIGELRFPIVTDPWCERYNHFLQNHPDAKYYRAEAPGDAEIFYCRDGEKGIWFLPGKAMGILQPRGLEMFKKIVDSL